MREETLRVIEFEVHFLSCMCPGFGSLVQPWYRATANEGTWGMLPSLTTRCAEYTQALQLSWPTSTESIYIHICTSDCPMNVECD